ncbi:glycosyltransferase family 4 protein [Christiangramia salexigens]|uniref:Glycosyl transferase family 1 n=1 Tax=Christiangramia salexigens TaxID=1913577 RepID=A0A1L3J2V5_9FLAO|nr:glycosyltransferase family 4 protein [Christiangramia salexigens]APG59451.1 glycosyl transferase family 1 [Christiangramia salexigens]
MEKVLIITYYWPPAGGPGVQRWLKFVKYLRDFDIEPVIYIPENPSYPIVDKTFASEVPEDLKIFKKPIFEPYAIAEIFSKKDSETISSGIINREDNQSFIQKLMLYIRGNFFIPDARKFWIKPSVKYLQEELKNNTYKAIITTGPPHSLHLIGLKLKETLNIKWIADFRDPWTNIGYHSKLKLSESSQKKHIELERSVLDSADHIITTSFTTKDEFTGKTSKPITVITNGFESENYGKVQLNNGFQFSHVGSLLSGRNPENLWKAFGELISENKNFKEKFELNLVGKVSQEVVNSIKSNGLESNLNFKSYVSHNEAIKIQRQSTVLLLIEINSVETRGIIPGKIFEYLASRRPVLAVGPKKWDASQILKESDAGEVFLYDDVERIKSYILDLFHLFENGKNMENTADISRFHRKNLTGKLANLIKEL